MVFGKKMFECLKFHGDFESGTKRNTSSASIVMLKIYANVNYFAIII
jgi:hypothetical protein